MMGTEEGGGVLGGAKGTEVGSAVLTHTAGLNEKKTKQNNIYGQVSSGGGREPVPTPVCTRMC